MEAEVRGYKGTGAGAGQRLGMGAGGGDGDGGGGLGWIHLERRSEACQNDETAGSMSFGHGRILSMGTGEGRHCLSFFSFLFLS